ncbi:MAG: hypothetical protein RLY86_3983 [Pseudomonadota bacterium]|jgi:quinolinate synthase
MTVLDKSLADLDLAYTPAVAAATQPIYERVKDVIPAVEWPFHAPLVHAINRLKRERNAVILAHNYQAPEIFHTVADIVGDSLLLARKAAETDADVIVLAGVHFMAETAKIINPAKTVLIPDAGAGCSLADSITAADVRLLRQTYPGVPIATYVNTSAEVKAESDVCITSGNAVKVIESLPGDTVLCIPDEYLAKWVATQTTKKVLMWKGHCEVHERFTGAQLRDYRSRFTDGITIIAHPECPPDVLAEADFVGSTAHMQDFVEGQQPKRVLLITECSMADNLQAMNPGVEFVKPCNLCPHMKKITLSNILQSLVTLEPRVEVDAAVADRARLAVERMLAVR